MSQVVFSKFLQKQKATLKSFFNKLSADNIKRIIIVFLINVISGAPYYLTGSTLGVYLKDMDFSLSAIGGISILNAPQAVKFLWSHIFDSVSIPYLSKRIGMRRSWMVLSQVIIIIALISISLIDPRKHKLIFFSLILVVNFLVSNYNILGFAFQMEIFKKNFLGISESVNVVGFRTGTLISGAFAIYLSSRVSWSLIYQGIAICMIPILIIIYFIRIDGLITEPIKTNKRTTFSSFFSPLKNLFNKKGSIIMFLFMIAYMLYDNILSNMPKTFHQELGFSKKEIAIIDGVFGVGMTLLGGFIAGAITKLKGYLYALRTGAIISALTGLSFLIQMKSGKNIPLLYMTVGLQELVHGFTITSFITFQISYCSVQFAVSQLAVLNSISSFSKYCFGSIAGVIAQKLGWKIFFTLVSLVTIPSIIIIWFFHNKFIEDYESTRSFKVKDVENKTK